VKEVYVLTAFEWEEKDCHCLSPKLILGVYDSVDKARQAVRELKEVVFDDRLRNEDFFSSAKTFGGFGYNNFNLNKFEVK
jgi:hypothetical protein